MARQRKEKSIKDIKLKQPDRSGPTEKTLFEIAEEKQLFARLQQRERELRAQKKDEPEMEMISPGAERVLDAGLWTATLAMLHFTFDVLAQHQYGTEIKWPNVCIRTARAWALFFILFYPLHPHEANPNLIPGIATKYQRPIRQAIFFTMSVISGCYLIYVTNQAGYLATQKKAPPLGCLWLWAVVELDLKWAVLSLLGVAGFLFQGGYNIK